MSGGRGTGQIVSQWEGYQPACNQASDQAGTGPEAQAGPMENIRSKVVQALLTVFAAVLLARLILALLGPVLPLLFALFGLLLIFGLVIRR